MWVPLTDFEAPAAGELTRVKVAGRALVLAVHDGCLHALDDRCPHMGVALSQMGRLDDGQIVCAWHGASIDVRTGHCESFPGVQTYPVEVRSEGVYVHIDEQPIPADKRPSAP